MYMVQTSSPASDRTGRGEGAHVDLGEDELMEKVLDTLNLEKFQTRRVATIYLGLYSAIMAAIGLDVKPTNWKI